MAILQSCFCCSSLKQLAVVAGWYTLVRAVSANITVCKKTAVWIVFFCFLFVRRAGWENIFGGRIRPCKIYSNISCKPDSLKYGKKILIVICLSPTSIIFLTPECRTPASTSIQWTKRVMFEAASLGHCKKGNSRLAGSLTPFLPPLSFLRMFSFASDRLRKRRRKEVKKKEVERETEKRTAAFPAAKVVRETVP